MFYSSWKNGLIKSLPILSGGVRYVIDYFTKEKVSGKLAEEKYDNTFRERPFTLCSRGLGSGLFYLHRDEIRKGEDLTIGSRKIPVPQYFKNLYGNYSDSEIYARYRNNLVHYKEIEKEAKRLKYSSVDKYLAYIQRSNELALESRLRNDNVPVLASYKLLDSEFDTQILASSALYS